MQRLFRDRAEAMAQMVTKEVGKPILAAREETFEYSGPAWGKAAEEILRYRGHVPALHPGEDDATSASCSAHRPLGVIGVITPFNFPTDISSIALAHAVAAGNTVVWKPTEYGPVCCAMVAELFEEAGFPPGVLNMVQGLGRRRRASGAPHRRQGHLLHRLEQDRRGHRARQPTCARCCWSSAATARRSCWRTPTSTAPSKAAITGAFYYAGQVCTSSERFFVHEAVYDEFLAKFRKPRRPP
jgi:succinate-semialdehyde dehydrogenase/glutarate-semialdehyde dehydrogenase